MREMARRKTRAAWCGRARTLFEHFSVGLPVHQLHTSSLAHMLARHYELDGRRGWGEPWLSSGPTGIVSLRRCVRPDGAILGPLARSSTSATLLTLEPSRLVAKLASSLHAQRPGWRRLEIGGVVEGSALHDALVDTFGTPAPNILRAVRVVVQLERDPRAPLERLRSDRGRSLPADDADVRFELCPAVGRPVLARLRTVLGGGQARGRRFRWRYYAALMQLLWHEERLLVIFARRGAEDVAFALGALYPGLLVRLEVRSVDSRPSRLDELCEQRLVEEGIARGAREYDRGPPRRARADAPGIRSMQTLTLEFARCSTTTVSAPPRPLPPRGWTGLGLAPNELRFQRGPHSEPLRLERVRRERELDAGADAACRSRHCESSASYADALDSLDDPVGAAWHRECAGLWQRAAQGYESGGRWRDAARCHQLAGDDRGAARCFESGRLPLDAAWHRAGLGLSAGVRGVLSSTAACAERRVVEMRLDGSICLDELLRLLSDLSHRFACDPERDGTWLLRGLALPFLLAQYDLAARLHTVLCREPRRGSGPSQALRSKAQESGAPTLLGWRLRQLGLKPCRPWWDPQDVQRRVGRALGVPLALRDARGVRFALIPFGSFRMGGARLRSAHGVETGARSEVTLTRAFYLAATPITQEVFESVMGYNPARFLGAGRLPVERVSWFEAEDFCRRLGSGPEPRPHFALPTEAEWERACRAETETMYWTGEAIGPDAANFRFRPQRASSETARSPDRTTPVDTFPPNPWGLFDMHGNVEEWCADGRERPRHGATTDPLGDPGNPRKIRRGGGWWSPAERTGSARRPSHLGEDRYGGVGLRPVLRLTQPPALELPGRGGNGLPLEPLIRWLDRREQRETTTSRAPTGSHWTASC